MARYSIAKHRKAVHRRPAHRIAFASHRFIAIVSTCNVSLIRHSFELGELLKASNNAVHEGAN
jgi:hypothetical protein